MSLRHLLVKLSDGANSGPYPVFRDIRDAFSDSLAHTYYAEGDGCGPVPGDKSTLR
jgi:hypothetical protein